MPTFDPVAITLRTVRCFHCRLCELIAARPIRAKRSNLASLCGQLCSFRRSKAGVSVWSGPGVIGAERACLFSRARISTPNWPVRAFVPEGDTALELCVPHLKKVLFPTQLTASLSLCRSLSYQAKRLTSASPRRKKSVVASFDDSSLALRFTHGCQSAQATAPGRGLSSAANRFSLSNSVFELYGREAPVAAVSLDARAATYTVGIARALGGANDRYASCRRTFSLHVDRFRRIDRHSHGRTA